MAKKNILAEAIADAKELKETALANAKIALTESFTPSLQRLVSTRIQEDDEDGEEVEIDTDMGAEEEPAMGFDSFDSGEDEEELPMEGMEGEDDLEMEALMRELDGEGDEDMTMEGDEFEDEMPVEEGEEESWADPIDEGDEMEYSDDELEEALGRVFEMDGLGDDLDRGENKEDGGVYDENPPSGPQFLENRKLRTEVKRLRTELKNNQKKLNESLRANTTYKKVLNEVNLLNSKLMYNTKVLRKFELTEGQRERILNSFDRANSVREVELVYTTVCEAFNKKSTKTKMVEGSASKTVKTVKPNPNGHIVNESLITRMQRLANIKKFED
jgi:hypothetical protein